MRSLRAALGTRWWLGALAALVVTVGLGGAALADGLPKLPPDFTFPQQEKSQDPVVFSHQTHVDAAKPSCAACHPKVFKMLQAGTKADGKPVDHDGCGACHGKDAFPMESCEMCHKK
jgi:c(7)-type cytochrome triheme protein